MTPRVKRLRDEMREWRDTVCLERPRIVTHVYRTNEADPAIIKRARALRAVLEQMPVYLRDGDLIPGTPTSTPGAWIVYPEFSMGTESIVQMRHNFEVGPDFIRDALPHDMREYWRTRSLYAHYWALRRECFGDTQPPPENWYQLGTALGHITPDFAAVLDRGLEGAIAQAEEQLRAVRGDDPAGAEFLRAVVIAAQGGITFARRYSELAAETAREVADPQRKRELEEMGDSLGRAVAKGARTFRDALRSVWLCNQIMHIEGNAWSMSPGRVDQIFHPFYCRDMDRGELAREDALELVQCFLIKFKENMVFGPRGNPTQCITLGGRSADGADQTNDLTYLFLEAATELKLPEPLVNLRWHEDLPDELMLAAFDCIAAGQNMPVFLNDEATPGGFMHLGIPAEDAFDYTHVGCGELGITGKLQDSALGGSTGHVHALVQTLQGNGHKGRSLSEQFPTFDHLLTGLEQRMRANAERSAEVSRVVGYVHEHFGQIPFTSAFMNGCIERARDLTVRADYNFPNMNLGGGFANFVNSVASIRTLVYQEEACDLDRLWQAMESNFDGHEELLAACRRAPKFGNDDDDADDLITVLEGIHTEAIAGLKGPRNSGRFIASGIDGGGHINAGRHLMATPDGRLAGQPMSPGMAAVHGSDRNGLTALLNTVQKADSQDHWFGGYTLNIRMMPDALETVESRQKLIAMLRAYFMGKGLNLHMNCVSADMLRDAQAHPEQYRDLVVRVSGYNDYFTMLSPEFQTEIIGRTEQGVG